MNKLVGSAAEAVADIGDGSTLGVGGFGLSGIPWILIDALMQQGASGLSVVSNNCGVDGAGLGILLEGGRIDHVIASYIGRTRSLPASFSAASCSSS